MAFGPDEIQTPKEWKRFADAVGRRLPSKILQARKTSVRIRAIGGTKSAK